MKTSTQHTVDAYIAGCPKEVQDNLRLMRTTIQKSAPNATERMDYFDMPGYSYDDGYDYNGMFVWFSYKKPFVRLHVRPPVLEDHASEVVEYPKTKAVVSFPGDKKLPITLIKKLVKASVMVMKKKKSGKV